MKRVVITGIGAVSPNGIGRAAFRDALFAGRSGVRRIQSFDPSRLESRIAGEIRLNGHSFSKKDERNLPRVAQLSLIASTEALGDAGIDPPALSEPDRARFGVLFGTGGGSAEFMERHYEMYYGSGEFLPSLYVVPASTPGGLSSELSIRFGLRGRSHVITTGCTSSTDAIGYAFHEIQAGRLTRALAGGGDAPIAEGILKGFSLMKVLSTRWNDAPEKASRPFSRGRDGFVPGEGAWMFVLEDKEHAEERGAEIYAELTGYGSSCEAFHSVRLDEEGGNFEAMRLAAEEAGVLLEEIDYASLHGTSTPLNDRVETAALKNFLGRRAYEIPMSAVKSMIGHPQGASGAAGLAATLLLMKEDYVHPTINLEEPDPECDLDYVAGVARRHPVRNALVTTLGFGSKCSALLVRNPAHADGHSRTA